MFVILVNYQKSLDVIDTLLPAHRAYLDIGYQQNYLIASGPRNPRTGGILLSQLTDRAVLEAFLSQDPYQLEGVASYEIIEFSPLKYHPDFIPFLPNTVNDL